MAGYDFKFLSDIFKDGLYSVPDYQRNYAWKEQQLKDLWEDLEGIELQTKSSHYTGTIVVEKVQDIAKLGKTYREFKIVDGQQRLATLSILISCICERLKKFGSPDSETTVVNLYNEYLEDKSIGVYKLKLNSDDDSFFKDVILPKLEEEMVGRNPTTHSERRLEKAKGFFRKKLEDKNLIYLTKLVEKITNRLIFIKYEVGDEVEAGLVFEVMNDRGKPLTQVDKIKNYLIYVAYKKGDRDLANEINEAWGEIFRNLMEVDRFNEDDLLRYHWIMHKGEYRTEKVSDVHRLLKEQFKLKNSDVLNGIRGYTRSLKEASYVFKELNNPYKFFADWPDNVEEIRKYLNGLHRLRNAATFMPLLMSARIVFQDAPEIFKEIVRYCENFAFRVYKIANRRTDTRYSSFCKLSNILFNHRYSDAKKKNKIFTDILEEIKGSLEEYCNDEELKTNLSRTNLYYGWMESYEVKYLLNELENKICQDKGESPPHWREIVRKSTIEHIWADSPRGWDSWGDELKLVHEKHVYKVGNLTLTFWNPTLSNKDFSEKREKYKESNLNIQRELAEHDSWGANEINERTKNIIQFVLERWKL